MKKVTKYIFGVLCTIGCSDYAQASSTPNIILLMSDDQGWGDTGYNGHPFLKTPHLDEMAKSSLQFDQFYAAGSVCSPTRASVLTGRNPNRTNVLDHGHYMRPQEDTIAEALKRNGYATGHFGKWHIGSVQKESPVCPGQSGFDEWITAPNYFDLDPYMSDNGKARKFKGESSKLVVDWTLKFIQTHKNSGKPFFAVSWFAAPHNPYKAVPPYDKMYGKVKKKDRGYYQEITAMDAQIGRLRRVLRKEGLDQNTLIWYCSDNGGYMEQTSGGRGRKGTIYEGGLRVPCLIEWPERIKPSVTKLPAFTSDIYPTLLEIVGGGANHTRELDGVSIVDSFDGQMSSRPGMGFWRPSIKGQATHGNAIVKQIMAAQKKGISPAIPARLTKNIDESKEYSISGLKGHSAWLQWPWKLHRIDDKVELYNLVTDEYEKNNVAAQHRERVETMKRKLDNWQKSVVSNLNGGNDL